MGWMRTSPRYKEVPTTDPDVAFEPSTSLPLTLRLRRNFVTYFNVIFLIANIVFLAGNIWAAEQQDSANWLLKRTNTYTPLLDRFDFSFKHVKNNASLFNTPYSIYKDDPSPEVDEAWEAIADTPVLVISKEDVIRIGKDPDYTVGVPEEWGYGPNKYFAANDGQHLIHCLNEVRKFAHYSHYYAPTHGPETNLSSMHAAHRSHCIGVLLDALTCQPSVNVVLWEWMEGVDDPWPDFGVGRKCVDHGAFYAWMEGVQVPRERIEGWDWSKGRGREREMLEEMKRLRGGGGGKEEHQHQHEHGHGQGGTWS